MRVVVKYEGVADVSTANSERFADVARDITVHDRSLRIRALFENHSVDLMILSHMWLRTNGIGRIELEVKGDYPADILRSYLTTLEQYFDYESCSAQSFEN